ncbi:hypothetical protein IJ103_02705 [Candidatus Saccharibacteria bacterium]|nr:hypothetical protein [Candidatus Saccharibacteria bacterium]
MRYLDAEPNSIAEPGAERASSAKKFGELITREMKRDRHLYLFSPDETTSNKLDETYEITERAWSLPIQTWDLPESERGRIVELLSENSLFAAQVGHTLGNKERSFMTSYEAFFQIISSQILQHLKFLKQVSEASWRKEPDGSPEKFPAVNLLSTSTCWRQDHNGFSHQSPALISTLLSVPSARVNCLFPVDDVAATASFDYMLSSCNVVNLTTFNKTDEPRWIDKNHARFQLENGGASILGFASNCGEDETADYVLVGAGDITTREVIYAARILNEDLPWLKIRVVNIAALSYKAIGTTTARLDIPTFERYFGKHAAIIANFHGYPETLKNILSQYADPIRVRAHGFEEQGSTTTPFEMLSLNRASRYDLALDVARDLGREDLVAKYENILSLNRQHARELGTDMIS